MEIFRDAFVTDITFWGRKDKDQGRNWHSSLSQATRWQHLAKP